MKKTYEIHFDDAWQKMALGIVRPKEDQQRNVEFTQRFNKELHDSVFL